MRANCLGENAVIGLVSPSHIAVPTQYEKIISGLERKGFTVKTGKYLYQTTYGYLAATWERAADLNNMICDNGVNMLFFGGGTGSVPLLPYIEYENIRKHLKLFVSYSDGTSILNAIYFQTGLETYYGQTPGLFENISEFDYYQFFSHFVENSVDCLQGNGKWKTICGGIAEGILVGGYLENVALEIGSQYFDLKREEKYLLFLEDHERFSSVAEVDMYLSHIEQNEGIKNVSGLLFGCYSSGEYSAESPLHQLFELLERFGKRNGIPVVYCDEFGYGEKHAILPIGRRVVLDADGQVLQF